MSTELQGFYSAKCRIVEEIDWRISQRHGDIQPDVRNTLESLRDWIRNALLWKEPVYENTQDYTESIDSSSEVNSEISRLREENEQISNAINTHTIMDIDHREREQKLIRALKSVMAIVDTPLMEVVMCSDHFDAAIKKARETLKEMGVGL